MNVATDFELMIKLLVLGDQAVGKSNIIFRFTEDKFSDAYTPTMGFDFKTKTHKTPSGKVIKLQIWDTVGQEKLISVSKSLLLKVQGIILVYDITNEESFDHIPLWIKSIKEVNDNLPIILVANKCDREDDRIVSFREGKEIASNNNMCFVEASSKTNVNIKEAFNKICDLVIINWKNQTNFFEDDEINISKDFEKISKVLSYQPDGNRKCPCCCNII